MKLHKAPAWAWQFGSRGALGHWAEPCRETLSKQEKPSPEAKIVPVYIMTRKQWREYEKIKRHRK